MLTAAPSTDNPQPPANSVARPSPNPHHHPRSGPGRRTVSISNGNVSANAMSPPVPTKPGSGAPAGPGVPPFDASRSPPGSKNLNHVPCKFFRQGACQAGKACPFSHNTDPGSDAAPCKYFSKGNCKFGQKCALAHILPDGRRVNRPPHTPHLQFGRMDPGFTNHRSALHNSLMQANVGTNVSHHTPTHSLTGQDDFPPLGAQPIPQIDQTLSLSLPDSQFGGSPRNGDGFQVSALASSQRTLGPLDATLPASIDRYDYSYFAKHGPFASSVPDTFGVDSPPPSLPNSVRGESTVSALRRSAFGDEETSGANELSRSVHLRESSYAERILHSATRRPKIYSSSYAGPQNALGGFGSLSGLRDGSKANDFSDGDFAFEEEFLPESLSDLLTPAERNRRMSRTDEESGATFRNSLTSPGTPADVFGSPPVGSPSSWGPIINRHKREDELPIISGVGHVGSPLRNSYLHSENASTFGSIGPASRGDSSPFAASAPVRGGAGVSALTQSLKLTSINDSEPEPATKTPITVPCKSDERNVSSPRLGNGRGVQSIDEEAECQFNLEVEEEGPNRSFGAIGHNTARASGLGLEGGFFSARS